ncbi:DUF4349 domain-containing protein [Phycicoccus sp. MAQZ13P-2]|uniref:DUF4349 domain-containing protein n=1 Tax=Phycicoccus mangrovi TaxID=2840470 RepID=UPI001C003800|nr:DUF4349 domain-containing protein [Phycicoccus mangrovi]MBT9254633.1 DUF4349 domain-containing protein [Phycicoccus mangrovi]MBT9273162.1 DUF4349 domain-containing protein [Phycicoccus mangrovi]
MPTTSLPPSRRLAAALAAGVLSVTALAACSASDSGASSSAAGGAADAPAASVEARDQAATAVDQQGTDGKAAAGGASAAVVPAVAERKLARRADVSLEVGDVARAASTLRAIATRQGGLVVAEEVSSDPAAQGSWGTITISVPTAKLDATLDEVGKAGKVLSRQTSTDDVTGQYVDTAARVETMKASVERVRLLMGRADKLADVVSLEAELSRRQADLESMEQQLAALDDQVSLSPVTVRLATPDAAAPTEEPTGFVAGLAAGWHAFTRSVQLVLTLLGAVLPFGVAAAVVLVPLVAWLRRRRPVAVATTQTPPAAPSA